MWHRVQDLWTHNRYLLLAFVLVVALMGVFGVRTASQVIYWADPAHQDQPLAGWMTPRYVGQSYDVPREVVQSAFDLPLDAPPRRVSLETLATEHGASMDDMQMRIDAAVADWRASHPKPRQ
jgi:hypothetical protein